MSFCLLSLRSCLFTFCISLSFLATNAHARRSPLHSNERRQTYDVGDPLVDGDADNHSQEFFEFVTRPDIDAPRCDIKIYDQEALSPGYWVMAAYEYVVQKEDDNRPWIGPLIYDTNGELVWSGAPMFQGYDIKDFRVGNVNGEDVLTAVYRRKQMDVILNDRYEIVKEVKIEKGRVNIHEFNTADNGTRVLPMIDKGGRASRLESQAVGYDGRCKASFPGFEEYDTNTWEKMFAWNSKGHIHLNESFIEHTCKRGWDYLHLNSVDKFPDGDYLMSGRHTDTLYKISSKDGSIVWRLGGKFSDFEFAEHFSGRHDAKVREQNSTHAIISILDNAIRPGEPHTTNDRSRGMVIALHTDVQPMTAEAIQKYDHPHTDYSPGRGNFQIMENGNAFLAWWMRSLISEHAPDGKVLMEASWKPELKSYRSYKFPWVGLPALPPDVHSEAFVTRMEEASIDTVMTSVHISWNGATEVRSWNLYKTTADGQVKELVTSMPRQGFETRLMYDGFASYVIVEAVDREGNILGESMVFKTISPAHMHNAAVLKEQEWIQRHAGLSGVSDASTWLEEISPVLSDPIAAYACGIATCATVVLMLAAIWSLSKRKGWFETRWQSKHQRDHRYEMLDETEVTLVDEEIDSERDKGVRY